MTREAVLAAFRQTLRAELDTLESVTRMAIDEATGDESKAENKYDTRGLEASYLARGQAERVLGLRRQLGWLDSARPPQGGVVGVGSVVALDEDGDVRWLFVVPEGGGRRVPVGDSEILALTREAPLGRALFGKEPGDAVVLGDRELAIDSVR